MLVFCARPSLIQQCGEAVGDEWRHAGILVNTDEGLFVAGFGRKDRYALMPVASLARYERVAVADPFDDQDERQRAVDWVEQFDGVPAVYPSSSIPTAWLLSRARTRGSRLARVLTLALCQLYCAFQAMRYRHAIAFICSTFVYAAVNASRAEPLDIDLTSPKATSPKRGLDSATPSQVRLARWLATPSDVWRAIPEDRRRDIDLREIGPSTPSLLPV